MHDIFLLLCLLCSSSMVTIIKIAAADNNKMNK